MNITMLHDLDTGFMAAQLKPAFQKLGHNCTIVQTIKTYLEGNTSHIDHLMSSMEDEDIHKLKQVFRETDLFIIRSVTDPTLRLCGVLPYINQHNTIWRVHGSELRERNVPYSLKTWSVDWHGEEPIIVGPRDYSLIPKYRGNVITQIERPCDFSIFPPRKRYTEQPYALHTPTRPEKKGTQELLDMFNRQGTIQLRIIHGVSRAESLRLKAGASYLIDYLGSYIHGPYGMNTVEAWYYRVPVFSMYKPSDVVMCPELPTLIHTFDLDDLRNTILSYEEDKKQLNNARAYALRTHDPLVIAQQYINLGKEIEQ